MGSRFHFPLATFASRIPRVPVCALLLAILTLCSASWATPEETKAVGRIDGSDVSVNGVAVTVGSGDSGNVANGDVVTVHAGQARFKLLAGGEISICGPAKFTALQSGNAITLALEFGRMHVELPAAVSLRIFTPLIVATPLDIRGGRRDVTVGLDQHDSLCVIAASGAVQLERQLSGQRMTIPENGDFSLSDAEFVPVADTGKACQCAAMPEALPASPTRAAQPEIAMNATPAPLLTTPPTGAHTAVASAPSALEPSIEYSVPAKEHEKPSQPASDAPVYKIILPPMAFSSTSPAPATPTAESALLIREVHVDPEWEFTGRVEPSEFAKDLSRALGEGGTPARTQGPGSRTTPQPAAPAKPNPQKPHRSLWAALRSIF